jgi:V8-like Glu-specific endopeptidase
MRSPARTAELAAAQVFTAEEMEAAEPCDVIEISEDMLREHQQRMEERPEAGPGAGLESGGPPQTATAAATAVEPTATTGGYDYPGPYTRHEVLSPYTTYPYVTIGKLFFEQGGRNFVCSASSIGNYAVWTAGHCVHQGNNRPDGWATRVVFVPAYRDGAAPYGQWPASHLWTRTAWYRSGIPGGLCEDMGGAILFPQGGRSISQVVGWLGLAWNWSRLQHWHALGYPAAAPFTGGRLIEVEASYAYSDGNLDCDPKPHATGDDMTGGCSGGPWVWRFGTGNYLNGNNSYRYGNRPEELYSPYFGNEAKALWDSLQASTP